VFPNLAKADELKYLHQAMAETLAVNGVNSVFGLAGSGNLFLVDSYSRLPDVGYYAAVNEAGVVMAACGYAQRTGGLGVATVTRGPGLTNTMTALVEATRTRTPMVLIVGDTPADDYEHVQNVDQAPFVAPTGAGFEQVRRADTALRDLAVAVRRAFAEQRPIVLNVPHEFWWEQTSETTGAWQHDIQSVAPDADAIDRAAGALFNARKPLIVAGRGASSQPAREAILELSRRLEAPVATTLRGMDLFRGHPWNVGIFGTLASIAAQDVIARADCVIFFGAGLNQRTTDRTHLTTGKAVVSVDLDRSVISRQSFVDVGVVGDAAASATAILALLDEAEIQPSGFGPSIAAVLADPTTPLTPNNPTHIDHVFDLIDAQFAPERTLVYDTGRYVFTAARRVHVQHPSAYVHTFGYGAIGLGMGAAIGAAVADPRPVLFAVGDGGFMNGGLIEFNTAVRYGLDITVVVINDGSYGAEYAQFAARGMDPSTSKIEWPPFADLAEAFGGRGFTATNQSELEVALKAAQDIRTPTLIDVRLDPADIPVEVH
jgi:thiamine pyrophosphate-dependent acetolactate synthase large subunit-like protein